MRVLMIGAGGVGGFFAAALTRAGVDLTVVARGQHGKLLKERGLRIEGSPQLETVGFSNVVGHPEELAPGFDLVILAVKWPGLEEACADLQRLLAAHGVVLPLLNGLESEEVVASFVGAQRTLAGVAYMSSGLIEPGRIYAHGNTRAGLAPFRPGQESDVERVAQLFERAGIPVRRHADHRAMLWEKMLWNAPFNAVCGLTNLSAGAALLKCEALVRAAMHEVRAVAAAEGVALDASLVDTMLWLTRHEFPLTEPSMLQDLRAGRPTEVAILQGAVVQRAGELKVEVPVLSTLASLIVARQR